MATPVKTVRDEIMTLPCCIDNPNKDGRSKRDWRKQAVIKAGLRLRFVTKDVTERYKDMIRHLPNMEERMRNFPTTHQVSIKLADGREKWHEITFHIHFEHGSEFGEANFDDEDKEAMLAKLLWENCTSSTKTTTEVVDEICGDHGHQYALVKLLELGKITKADLEEAYNA